MNKIIILALTSVFVSGKMMTEMTPQGEAMIPGLEPLMDMKDLYVEHILINGIPYELYEDTDKDGDKYYYLKLQYAGDKWGGFLADRMGNLIDFDGNILTTVEDIADIMDDSDAEELLDQDEDFLKGILIKKIVEASEFEAPDDELMDSTDLCCLGSCSLPKVEFCCKPKCSCFRQKCCFQPKCACRCAPCNPCNQCRCDGTVVKEVPVAIQKKVYYDVPQPFPVYKKKIIPYTVTEKQPVYIKKCIPCHIPVKVPVKCPVDVCVPCYKPYTTVVPVKKDVYRQVPKVYYKQKLVYEKVPKVCTVRVPCYKKQIVAVPCPYKVVQKVPCVNTVTNVVKVPYKVTQCIPVKQTKIVKEYVDCCNPCCQQPTCFQQPTCCPQPTCCQQQTCFTQPACSCVKPACGCFAQPACGCFAQPVCGCQKPACSCFKPTCSCFKQQQCCF